MKNLALKERRVLWCVLNHLLAIPSILVTVWNVQIIQYCFRFFNTFSHFSCIHWFHSPPTSNKIRVQGLKTYLTGSITANMLLCYAIICNAMICYVMLHGNAAQAFQNQFTRTTTVETTFLYAFVMQNTSCGRVTLTRESTVHVSYQQSTLLSFNQDHDDSLTFTKPSATLNQPLTIHCTTSQIRVIIWVILEDTIKRCMSSFR